MTFCARQDRSATAAPPDRGMQVREDSDGWSWGKVNGRSGFFPTNFVDRRFVHA